VASSHTGQFPPPQREGSFGDPRDSPAIALRVKIFQKDANLLTISVKKDKSIVHFLAIAISSQIIK
jgi:hypothetical protein